METKAAVKTGPITLALGLIALGAGALAVNLGFLSAGLLLKFWPVLLIGLGLEYFVRKLVYSGREVQFSLPSVIVTVLLALALWLANTIYGFTPAGLIDELLGRHGPESVSTWQGEPVEIAGGSRLEVENGAGSVEIVPSPDGRLHVSARIVGTGLTGGGAGPGTGKVFVEPGRVTRVYTKHADGRFSRVMLKVEAPEGLKISVSNKLGSITASNTSAELLSLDSSAGSVEVDGHRGALNVENRLGEITVKNVNGTVDIEGSAGRINIINPAGNVTAESKNGAIRLDSSVPLDKNYILKGENGEIAFRAPRNSSLKVQASSRNGGIIGMNSYRSDYGQTRGEAVIGGGAGSVRLETRNGAIKFEMVE